MDSQQWQRIQEIFEGALEVDPRERDEFIDAECNGDDALRAKVESLLRSDSTSSGFIEPPSPATVSSVLDGGATRSAPPERIGHYDVIHEIATGGMGTVYLARRDDAEFEQTVAIKVIKAGHSESILQRFRIERQTLARLNHPNIARLLDGGATDDGRPYFVMEYIDGQPIDEYCDSERLSLTQRLELFRTVCAAVQYAHRNLVVHRDLKPCNILVDKTGAPKLLDFGIARLLAADEHGDADEIRLTETGMRLMTPQYASPEQVRGDDVTTASDVYSLSVILYELLTGRSPYRLRTRLRHEVERAICEDEPERPSTTLPRGDAAKRISTTRATRPERLRRMLTGDLDTIVLRAMDKQPERRYLSVEQLSEDIHRTLTGLPVLARRDTWAYRTGKFIRRNPLPVTAAIGIVAILLVSVLFILQAATDARTAAGLAALRLEEVLRASDIKRLRDYRLEAEGLWPANERTAAAMAMWIAKAEVLADRLPLHEATWNAIRAGRELDPDGGISFDSEEEAWEHDNLSELVAGLRQFTDPQTGTLSEMRARHAFASEVRNLSIVQRADEWNAAIASIANRDECPAYNGLSIVPQLGLAPIGRDPASGLWEFAHLQSGTPPRRAVDGTLEIEEETGIVLVLIPGGSFHIGTVRPVDANVAMHGNVDPWAQANETPCTFVEVDPFFISKYEMTQAQWMRVTRGPNPSVYHPDYPDMPRRPTLLHPVESVSWDSCVRILWQLDLILPTEAQWEYAVRAGTRLPWWTGAEPRSLQGAANLADGSGPRVPWPTTDVLQDDFVVHGPADTMIANPFGLHHTIGNVSEWVREPFGLYLQPISPGTAERQAGEDERRLFRGGGFNALPVEARCATRRVGTTDYEHAAIGLRATRRLGP